MQAEEVIGSGSIELKFRIPAIPISYSQACKINFSLHQTYLSREAREFVMLAKQFIPPKVFPQDSIFGIDIDVHTNWLTKEGKCKRKDVRNLDRLLIDAIFNKIGFDDSLLWVVNMRKVQDTKDYTDIRLYTYGQSQRIQALSGQGTLSTTA